MNPIITGVLNSIPDYKTFLTVEEMDESSLKLKEKYPDLVELHEAGKTVEGNSILCLKIGKGRKNMLLLGSPHPNEPMGCMMLEYFSEELCKNKELRESLDYTFHIIKCWDIDGTKLNEKWFKGPFTLYNYSRNFYRPAGFKQVDWTFPFKYKEFSFDKPLPETEAVMKLIDEIKPEILYPIHNSGFGGVYWYLSEDLPDVYEDLYSLAEKEGLPLHLGEPEAPFLKSFSDAIYSELTIRDEFDYLTDNGAENPQDIIKCGTCSADYSSKYNTFSLVAECPYFYDPRINDLNITDRVRKDVYLENIMSTEKYDSYIHGIIGRNKKFISSDNPFYLALEAFRMKPEQKEANIHMAENNPEFKKKATIAEVFDNMLVSKFYKMLSLGMLIRCHEYELFHNKDKFTVEDIKILEETITETEGELKRLNDFLEKEIHYTVIPIKKLISIQLGSGLLFAFNLQEKNKQEK